MSLCLFHMRGLPDTLTKSVKPEIITREPCQILKGRGLLNIFFYFPSFLNYSTIYYYALTIFYLFYQSTTLKPIHFDILTLEQVWNSF